MWHDRYSVRSTSASIPDLVLDMPKKQKFPYLVGSKWTAQQETWGWRHFQVVNRKNQGAWVFAEMVAACDPAVRFWMNAKLLKDRSQWQAGWKSLHEVEEG
ncbi:tryptophan-rich Ignore [Leptolyngbya boryana NIES-2135]|uniref:Tryptophan-rich Ignore n=2 Tax=Leptolyngbya boryana TaxID=1184 RepID=A0A1Z4JFS1_LEPBY|nr:tryptophan-rich Ignore [Leptolyngbya boryana NIES-2135]